MTQQNAERGSLAVHSCCADQDLEKACQSITLFPHPIGAHPARAQPMPTQPQRLHYDANWHFGRLWAGAATRSMVAGWAHQPRHERPINPMYSALAFSSLPDPRSARRVLTCMLTAYHVPK